MIWRKWIACIPPPNVEGRQIIWIRTKRLLRLWVHLALATIAQWPEWPACRLRKLQKKSINNYSCCSRCNNSSPSLPPTNVIKRIFHNQQPVEWDVLHRKKRNWKSLERFPNINTCWIQAMRKELVYMPITPSLSMNSFVFLRLPRTTNSVACTAWHLPQYHAVKCQPWQGRGSRRLPWAPWCTVKPVWEWSCAMRSFTVCETRWTKTWICPSCLQWPRPISYWGSSVRTEAIWSDIINTVV